MSSDDPSPIASELPHLRRYARALFGAQADADAYVSATLSALVGEGAAHGPREPPRIALFRAFHRISHVRAPGAGPWPDDVDGHLQGLSIGRRQALLLVAMEGFSPADAALILGIAPTEIALASAAGGIELEAGWPSSAAAGLRT